MDKDSGQSQRHNTTPPHGPFDPASTHSTPSSHSCLEIASNLDGDCDENSVGISLDRKNGNQEDMNLREQEEEDRSSVVAEEEESLIASSPDYDYLAAAEEEEEESSLVASSPDYDYLGFDSSDPISNSDQHYSTLDTTRERLQEEPDVFKPMEAPRGNEYEYVMMDGDEYILGTLMVRVLQARHVKLDNQYNDGGGLSSLLSNHRRTRHKKYTQSPLSSGVATPNSHQTSLYSKLSFRSQHHYTHNAVPGNSGDYYWSRGDQSYFDVLCPTYQRIGYPFGKKKVEKKLEEEDDVCCKSNKEKSQKTNNTTPLLTLSLFAKKGVKDKQLMSPSANKKSAGFDAYHDEEGQYIGECSINITRVLTGKTAYFDEWCTLHNDGIVGLNDQEDGAGRVRVVIEYEPTDSPPRSGDVCVFANIYPDMEREMYPVPLYSVRTNPQVFRSGSSTSFERSISASNITLSSAGSSSVSCKSGTASQLIRQPKQFYVEESVGDHVILSYQTPEHWSVTFEVHRYNLLVTHRYCGTVEKVKEGVLDFCDNISQSPMLDVLHKTIDEIPNEGLVFVGAEAMGAGMAVLGRWMEVGLNGALEDVVDVTNLDGRYSHLSDDEEDEDETQEHESSRQAQSSPLQPTVIKTELQELTEKKEALPGMPCCPITGQPMINPVVAADGHTYEKYAIARWFQTSNRSPLTGEVMAHANLVPNYLLLSSLSGDT